jgi:hypothetical protein
VIDARKHLQTLVGQEVRTLVDGRPNRILRIEGDQVIVATGRSPVGSPVPIEWLQDAIDLLKEQGEVAVDVETLGHRSSFVRAFLATLPGATVESTTPRRVVLKQVERMRLSFRNGVVIDDPLRYALAFLENDWSYRVYDLLPVARDAALTLSDIRAANKILARMSAVESEVLYARRDAFEAALRQIPPDASLCDEESQIPWRALRELFAAANGVPGIGLAKLTKFLHKKRPELIPLFDSVVEGYLRSVGEIPLRGHGFGVVGEALTRSYKVDLDTNLETVRAVKKALGVRGFVLSECRIMDLFTWAYAGENSPAWAANLEVVEQELAPDTVDEVAELAADVGVASGGDSAIALQSLISSLGYVRARRILREWRRHHVDG